MVQLVRLTRISTNDIIGHSLFDSSALIKIICVVTSKNSWAFQIPLIYILKVSLFSATVNYKVKLTVHTQSDSLFDSSASI